jgi:hypothetical protein
MPQRSDCEPSVIPGRCAALVFLALAACRGEAPNTLGAQQIEAMVDSLRPSVEAAVGLPFKTPPRSSLVTRDQVRGYLLAKVQKEYPPERIAGVESAYRLLQLLPDTLDLKRLLLDLYSEQVAGYYDPDSSLLYAVRGGDRSQLRLVMAHEMVHALQHQYLPLDSLMLQQGNGDRLAAAQAVLEGQATVASIRILAPGTDVLDTPGFWETYREQVREQQKSMPVFAGAPLILREGLIFPYLAGAEFMRWWAVNREEPLPIGALLPLSTEQVLHPDRYASADLPAPVRFADSAGTILHEDTLGELEIQILLAVLRSANEAALDRPIGWGGDRYRVYEAATGPALVWYSSWDSQPVADRFLQQMREGFVPRPRPGYKASADAVLVSGKPGVRLVHAPEDWSGWSNLPAASGSEK